MKEPKSSFDTVFKLGDFLIEPSSGMLRKNDKIIHLAPKVMELLLVLAKNQDKVVTKEELLSSVWPNTFVTESSLTRSISELRHVLGDNTGTPIYIETIPKRGYRFLGQIEESSKSPKKSWNLLAIAGITVSLLCLILSLLLFTSRDNNPVYDEIHSLAVIPFAQTNTEPKLDIFAVEVGTIIASLSKINGLRVNTGFFLTHLENSPENLEKIAEKMGMHSLLGINFQTKGEKTAISVKLSNVRSKDIVWQHEYLLDEMNRAEISFTITQQVANALNLELTPSAIAEIQNKLSNDFQTNQYLIMADYLRKTGVSHSRNKAIKYAEKAIIENPQSALAHSILAEAYMAVGGWGKDKEYEQKAREAVSKALTLNDQIPDSHIANGIFLRTCMKDYLSSELAFKKAILLDPTNPKSRREYGLLLMRNLGRSDEALHQLQKACRLDPLFMRIYSYLFELYYARGDYESALESAIQNFELHPSIPFVHQNLALVHMLLGETSVAISWAESSIRLLDVSPEENQWEKYFQLLVLLQLQEGRISDAAETSQRLHSLSPDNPITFETNGLVALYKKDLPLAESWFRQAFELVPRGFIWPTGIRLSTFLSYVIQQKGEHIEAEELLELSTRRNRENNALAYEKNFWPPLVFQDNLAGYSIRGKSDEGLRELGKAVEKGWNAYAMTENNPIFTNLLESQKVEQTLNEVKLRVTNMRKRIKKQQIDIAIKTLPPAS